MLAILRCCVAYFTWIYCARLEIFQLDSHLEYQRGKRLRFTFQFCKKLHNKGTFDFLIHLLLSDGSGNFLSRFPGRDETGNAVSSRLVSRFWVMWKSCLVSNLNFRRLKSLVLSRNAFCCLDLSWMYLSCLVSKSRLVLYHQILSRPIKHRTEYFKDEYFQH